MNGGGRGLRTRGSSSNRYAWRNTSRGRGQGQGNNDIIASTSRNQPGPAVPIKQNNVITSIKNVLPGYCLYYLNCPPTLPNFEDKILLVYDYLKRKDFVNETKLTEIESKEYFELEWVQINQDPVITKDWPNFNEDLTDKPNEVINLFSSVMHKMISQFAKKEDTDGSQLHRSISRYSDNILKANGNVGRIQAGIIKTEPLIPLSGINSSLIGKFIVVRGAVVGTGVIRPSCFQLTFYCKTCKGRFMFDQPEGIFTMPGKCGAMDDCENKIHFDPLEDADTNLMIDCRKIRLQDIHKDDARKGSIPLIIDCELKDSLVAHANTGDVVSMSGIVKIKKDISLQGEQSLYNMYIEVVTIKNYKDLDRSIGGNWFTLTDKDFYAINEIQKTPNLFRLLTASLCPSICGLDLVKASLILALFGGAQHEEENTYKRSDINVLLIGDPGLGKSQILKMVTEVAPKGVYVCGTGSTVAGLTITLVKEGAEYSIEAGALVMANGGVCCIDEFDKMKPQHPALLEVMEQQTVSIAKAGVFRTFPARTSVIAAGNPVDGYYDKHKTFNENTKINSAILSRFDVIFLLTDQPDKDLDSKIIKHVMGNVTKRQTAVPEPSTSHKSQASQHTLLIDRLKISANEDMDFIPHTLMRTYIAYAKQYVKPKISKDAATVLKDYYLRLRERSKIYDDSAPITIRQLESLLRLTEARAKVELREIATVDDAKDALEIFDSGLADLYAAENNVITGLSQIMFNERHDEGNKMGIKKQAHQLLNKLQKTVQLQSKNIFTRDELKEISDSLGLQHSLDDLLDILNTAGFILKNGVRTFQVL